MVELPSGTVTLLFTDIEGSTRLLHQFGARYADVLADHRDLLRVAFAAHDGHEVDTQGDAFFVAFSRAADAVAAAVAAQRALASRTWDGTRVRVRMGIHSGEPMLSRGGYVGIDVHRGARVASAAHGGQVLLSQTTRALVDEELPAGVTLRDLGQHRLKDLRRPEGLFQLVIDDLPANFPPLRTLDAFPNNLPTQRTMLVGREQELQAVREQLLRDEVGLLTLTGSGGIGKTRLGLQVAADLIQAFPDGVYYVQLATVTDPALVASAIARTLALRETVDRPIADGLIDYLKSRRVLLLLDNFEQVLGAAPLVSALLAACPRAKVLVTSRSVLHLSGEHEYPVPPLGLPGRGVGTARPTAKVAHEYAAVRLFVDHARTARPDFDLTEDNAAAVVEICERLVGLPLAIELAAARVRVLPPAAMIRRLERRLPLLVGGARDAPERQRTLRDAIAWSYDLLTVAEQRLFRRLAVFVGGFTLASAQQVCDDAAVLDGVTSLVESSMLRRDERPGDEPRFLMLETVREYGLESLDASGEAADVRRRHAEHFTAVAEEAETQIRGRHQIESLDRLELEHDNLRAALGWSLTDDDLAGRAIALRLAGALSWFWRLRDHFRDGSLWLSKALAAGTAAEPASRLKALVGAGLLAFVHGDEDAEALLTEGLGLARELRDPASTGWALHGLGRVFTARGDDRAIGTLEESRVHFREAKDDQGRAYSAYFLGAAARGHGDFEIATGHFEEALSLLRRLGDPWGIAWALLHWARLELVRPDHERAAVLLEEALVMCRDVGTALGLEGAFVGLAEIAAARRDHRTAAMLCGAAAAVHEVIGDPAFLGAGTRYGTAVAAARAALGEAAFMAAWGRGRALPLEDSIALALGKGGDLASQQDASSGPLSDVDGTAPP